MLTLTERVLFVLAVLFSAYGAMLGFRTVWRVIRRGSGKPLRPDMRRGFRALGTWLLAADLWKMRRFSTVMHTCIASGFVFYLLVNIADVLRGFGFDIFHVLPVARFLSDIFSAAVLVGMTWFLIRRFLVQTRHTLKVRPNVRRLAEATVGSLKITPERDSLVVGLFILGHVGFRFLGESFSISAGRVVAGSSDAAQPLASMASLLWTGTPPEMLDLGIHVCWWLSLGLILAFIPYFPYTKHFHFVMAGVNFWTRPDRSSIGALDPLNFADESISSFGAERIEDLPPTSLVDAFSCIMCNRCQEVCPAYDTDKDLSPAALEISKRYYLTEHMQTLAAGESSGHRLLDFAISTSAVWACTACGACVDVCPVGNEPMHDILDIRRNLVLMEGQFPDELQAAYRGMERNGNPWNTSVASRTDWHGDLTIPTTAEEPNAEVLWWVGCAPSYDSRAQKTAQALARVMQAAGVRFATLGAPERCSGDPARRSGNEYLFDSLARDNITTLQAANPERIITTCPHCLHTLGKEYAALGGSFEVIHHTQFLEELIAEGRLCMESLPHRDTITFHDPCYLGRMNGITDPPRHVLDALGAERREMPRSRTKSFCCGAGGGQMWKEEVPPRINETRYAEAKETGANTIAVGCPFCMTMMEDAAQSSKDPLQVKDVVELIADRLPTAV